MNSALKLILLVAFPLVASASLFYLAYTSEQSSWKVKPLLPSLLCPPLQKWHKIPFSLMHFLYLVSIKNVD